MQLEIKKRKRKAKRSTLAAMRLMRVIECGFRNAKTYFYNEYETAYGIYILNCYTN
jgi:hypothetical protein